MRVKIVRLRGSVCRDRDRECVERQKVRVKIVTGSVCV